MNLSVIVDVLFSILIRKRANDVLKRATEVSEALDEAEKAQVCSIIL
jgi:hypothetical protein